MVGKDTLSHDVQPADDGTHLLDVGKSILAEDWEAIQPQLITMISHLPELYAEGGWTPEMLLEAFDPQDPKANPHAHVQDPEAGQLRVSHVFGRKNESEKCCCTVS